MYGGEVGSTYPSIGDYAVIGDCRTAALVSSSGSIDWLCFPHFSGRSVFAALLDTHQGGHFYIRPAIPYKTTRCYIGDSNVLETTFHTERGIMTLTDGMSVVIDNETPGYAKPQRELLRILKVVSGRVPVEIVYQPRPDYARHLPKLRQRGKLGWSCDFKDELLHLNSSLPLKEDNHSLILRQEIENGERHYFSLTYVKSDPAVIPPVDKQAELRLQTSIDWWQQWADRCTYRGPYRDAVVRSLLTIKLLTYALSGAVIAAPTTSLPERMGGDWNWDYRYCWIRDAAITLRAFFDLGYNVEADGFLGWLLNTTRLTRPELQVMYDVYGETQLPERELNHLEGYRQSRPVRIGNKAAYQRQMDIYGQITMAAFEYVQRGGKLDRYERNMLVGFGNVVCRRWQEPDNGIWERRGPIKHHTLSKAMCWVTLDRLLTLSNTGALEKMPVKKFRDTRNAIRKDIETHGFNNELNSYVAAYNSTEIDAALLLLAESGYCAYDSPRMIATFDRIKQYLEHDALLLRTTDINDRTVHEGTFGICGFWAVDYLAQRGDLDEATQRFEQLLELANDVGLYGEEMELKNGEPLGNYPQAYTHVGLITAAVSLQEAHRKRLERNHVQHRRTAIG